MGFGPSLLCSSRTSTQQGTSFCVIMTAPTDAELINAMREIIKGADLDTLTFTIVLEVLTAKYGDLSERKPFLKAQLPIILNEATEEEEVAGADEPSNGKDADKHNKEPEAPVATPPKKKKETKKKAKEESSEEDEDDDGEEDDEEEKDEAIKPEEMGMLRAPQDPLNNDA